MPGFATYPPKDFHLSFGRETTKVFAHSLKSFYKWYKRKISVLVFAQILIEQIRSCRPARSRLIVAPWLWLDVVTCVRDFTHLHELKEVN